MPIYEYYCERCHMILNFFARTPSPSRQPDCPHCGKGKLPRQVSLFATGRKGASEGAGGDGEGMDGLDGMDEHKMERAMELMASEAEHLNEDDPRAAAKLMRKFSNVAGMEFNEGIEQALQRMENGEDPEHVEAEMGDVLDDANPFVVKGGAKPGKQGGRERRQRGAPRHDAALYDL
ncbi:MAG TPA: hypothetical protein DCS43_11350 [Verrucomicrobia bacterium]|nr:hypothetical protein [Verrucomicrobiota bacterium]